MRYWILLLPGTLLLGTLLLAGCAPDAPSNGERALTCTPDTLRPGQSLSIQLPADPGEDLAVVDPNGTVYLAYRAGTAHPQLLPAPSSPKLSGPASLRWSVDSLEMKPYAYDARAAMIVFRQAGTYDIRLGTNVATASTPRYHCSVHYAPNRP